VSGRLQDPATFLTTFVTDLVRRRTKDGSRKFTRLEVEDFFAAVIITLGFVPSALPAELARMMVDFAHRAQVADQASPEENTAAVERYFEAHPIDRELSMELARGLREMTLLGAGDDLAQTFARFSGTAFPAERRAPGSPPPQGAVRAGPLGYFLAQKKLGGS
jgi:hypothetical protein